MHAKYIACPSTPRPCSSSANGCVIDMTNCYMTNVFPVGVSNMIRVGLIPRHVGTGGTLGKKSKDQSGSEIPSHATNVLRHIAHGSHSEPAAVPLPLGTASSCLVASPALAVRHQSSRPRLTVPHANRARACTGETGSTRTPPSFSQ